MPESTRCCLCDGSEYRDLANETRLLSLTNYRVVQCRNCGLAFMNPRPTEEELNVLYQDSYFEFIEDESYRFRMGNEFPARLDLIDRFAGAKPHAARLLDVGSANGDFLAQATKRGWEPHGIEYSKWGVTEALRKYGIPCIQGGIEYGHFEAESFDCVHMNHVLEHLREPFKALVIAHQILKPEGLLVVEVPNQFKEVIKTIRDLLGLSKPSPRMVFHHLYFFEKKTLIRIIEKAGFKIEHCSTMKEHYYETQGKRLVHRAKKLLYELGAIVDRGPIIEVVARKCAAS